MTEKLPALVTKPSNHRFRILRKPQGRYMQQKHTYKQCPFVILCQENVLTPHCTIRNVITISSVRWCIISGEYNINKEINRILIDKNKCVYKEKLFLCLTFQIIDHLKQK